MDTNNEANRNYVTYGSIISFMLDYVGDNIFTELSYNPNEVQKQKNKNKSETFSDYLCSRDFLYSHGVFNEYCFFYKFKDKTDLKENYFNSLFLVLPPCEYESLNKFKLLTKKIKEEIMMGENLKMDKRQITDYYIKFKQEIQTNNDYSIKLMNKENNFVNFNDCVQFMHIKSGKFLRYKVNNDYLKIYVQLTENVSQNTLFRFIPAFNYQSENSTRVFFDLAIKITCGGEGYVNEKFMGKEEQTTKKIKKRGSDKTAINKKIIELGKRILDRACHIRPSLAKAKNTRKSIKMTLDTNASSKEIKNNFIYYISKSNIIFKGYGKKIAPQENHIVIDSKEKTYKLWRLISFSKNYLEDNKYLNVLEYFCIQNTEKNLFLQAQYEINDNFDNSSQSIDLENPFKKATTYPLNNNDKSENYDEINIELNYFFNEKLISHLNCSLIANNYDENDYMEPFGLFKLEVVKDSKNKDFYPNINVVDETSTVRFVNIVSNKVLCAKLFVDKNNNEKKFEISLIKNDDEKLYDFTLFELEKVNDYEEVGNDDDESDENDEKSEKSEKESKKDENISNENDKYISKKDYVNIKSKKYGKYLGIKQENINNTNKLVMISSPSEMTRFKINCLGKVDKYEFHFMEQLLRSFLSIEEYYKKENELDIKDRNYENIIHILIKLHEKIKEYADRKAANNGEEKKFDFMKIIEQFHVVSKLVDIFLSNFLHNYTKMEIDRMDKKICDHFKDEKDSLKCKSIIGGKILKILTLIYDLNKSYLDVIQDRLIYFFLFVGRYDKCTKFLIHILKNNRVLLLSLCPISTDFNLENKGNITNEEEAKIIREETKYNNLKKCLERIISDYNSIETKKMEVYFSSIFLFFKLLDCLIIYEDEPFYPFYDSYFANLNLVIEESPTINKPNYENNPILIDFIKNEDKSIKIVKYPFFQKIEKSNPLGNIIVEEEKEKEEKQSDSESENDDAKGNSDSNTNTNNYIFKPKNRIEIDLMDLINLNMNNTSINYSKILLSNLIDLNILFYSNLSLCDKKFKAYLQKIFDINSVIGNYLDVYFDEDGSFEKKLKSPTNMNTELKIALSQLINHLYFRISIPYSEKSNLFKCLDENTESNILARINTARDIREDNLNKIIKFISDILEIKDETKKKITHISPFLLLQMFNCCKYTMINLYSYKNDEKKIEKSFELMEKILFLIEKYIGFSTTLTSEDKDTDEQVVEALTLIINDNLELSDSMLLISDMFLYIFEKHKKRLENIIRSKSMKNNKKIFKDLLGSVVTEKKNQNYAKYVKSYKLRKKSRKILDKCDLSQLLLEVSANSNMDQKALVHQLLYMMTEIFLNFLNYIENLSIDEIGKRIINANKVENLYDDTEVNCCSLIESISSLPDKDYLTLFKTKYILNSYSISKIFFKFLQITDNNELKKIILEIIYRLNSQKKIFYENITNLIILNTEEDFNNYIEIRNKFNDMFIIVKNINLVKRLDKNTITLFNDLKEILFKLINQLLDEKQWRISKNFLNVYHPIKFTCEDERIKSNPNNNYYLKEFSRNGILNLQQTLFNLGFVDFINEFFGYYDWLIHEIKIISDSEMNCLENILISIYKLMSVFIYINDKHQVIIKNKLFLYLCPLNSEKVSQNILLYVGYFLLNLVRDFEDTSDFNQIKNPNLILNILNSLKNINWKENSLVVPFYVESIKKILEYSNKENFYTLFPVLEKMGKNLVDNIKNKTGCKNDAISLVKILELIVKEQDNRKKNKETKTILILSLEYLVDELLELITLYENRKEIMNNLILSKIFNIAISLLYDNFNAYKNEFKRFRKKIVENFHDFTQIVSWSDDLIYCSKTHSNQYLIDFNEFLGVSFPKLYILISATGAEDGDTRHTLEQMIRISNELYKRIEHILTKNKYEKIFLNEEEVVEIVELSKLTGEYLRIPEKIKDYSDKAKIVYEKQKSLKFDPEINEIYDFMIDKASNRKMNFHEIWGKIKLKIYFKKGLDNFQTTVTKNINTEREKFIEILYDFFIDIDAHNAKLKNNTASSIIFFNKYISAFKEFYGNDFVTYRNEIFFHYWTNIIFMRFNKEIFNSEGREISSFEDKTSYNKEYFKDLEFVESTIKQFNHINVFANDYENFLYLQFFNCYLFELKDEDSSKLLKIFIDKTETENIFNLVRNILDELKENIIKDIELSIIDKIKQIDDKNPEGTQIENKNEKEEKSDDKKTKKKKYHYTSNLFENELDKYTLAIKFLIHLSEKNSIINNQMKDYLRMQYNNTKNHNFIIIFSRIIDNFIPENENEISDMDSNFLNDNRTYISKYYSVIIKILEFLTKCCTECRDNQDCVVKETKILNFAKNILKTLTYRCRKYNDDGVGLTPSEDEQILDERIRQQIKQQKDYDLDNKNDNNITDEDDMNLQKMFEEKKREEQKNKTMVNECSFIKLDRKRLAFLKYKLLFLISELINGRKKGDKIYEQIHEIIDFDVLISLLIETYKEILLERKSQKNHENLIFGVDLLFRMENFDYKNPSNIGDHNFIIFEIGTISYILINDFLENLARPFDIDIFNRISAIRQQVKKSKYDKRNKTIFDETEGFVNTIFRSIALTFTFWLLEASENDFELENSFEKSYNFFFEYTPNIEIIHNDQIIRYYVKLSPICKCLTKEMKDMFHSDVDRSSAKLKLEFLFNNVDYYHYQLKFSKDRLDVFRKFPLLDLFFNRYEFFRDLFLILGSLLNLLLFASLYRTNDDHELVEEYSEDFSYDYGFLYKEHNIHVTRLIFFCVTIIETAVSFLIVLNYMIIYVPNLLYYKVEQKVGVEPKKPNLLQRALRFIYNFFNNKQLLYHIVLFAVCLISSILQNYKIISILLFDVIERSPTLMNIVKSFWIPKKQILVTLLLFYLIAYYFIIFIYLFIPYQLPTKDCFIFADCFFTLSDQTIKNSNGIINYLEESYLIIYNSLWQNPRFWIDNWFAIIDILLVLQMICGIIIDTFSSQREKHDSVEEDKKNICFICGLNKTELNKYYCSESGFEEHIKLDHNLWNYMFAIFNVTKEGETDLDNIEQLILDNYKQGIYSWVPYKKCMKQNETEANEDKESEENDDNDDED